MKSLMRGILVIGSVVGMASACRPRVDGSDVKETKPSMNPMMMAMQAGDYNYVTYNKSEMEALYLQEVFKGRDKDYKFFTDSITGIEKQFVELLTSLRQPKGLLTLSQLSENGTFSKAEDFIQAVNDYEIKRSSLQVRIRTVTSMTAEAFPEVNVTTGTGADAVTRAVPAFGKMDFSKLEAFYSAKMQELHAGMTNLPHKILMLNDSTGGVPVAIEADKGLSLKLPKQAISISSDDLKKMQDEISVLLTWVTSDKQKLNEFGAVTRKLVLQFINRWGTTQKWRFQKQGDEQQIASDLEQIKQFFWARSYIRTKYGLGIGTFNVNYRESFLNLDQLFNSTNSLFEMSASMAIESGDVQNAHKNLRRALDRLDKRSASIMDGQLGVFAGIENLSTYIAGDRPVARAGLAVMRLIAADVYEEYLMVQLGGVEQMSARYREMYSVPPKQDGSPDSSHPKYVYLKWRAQVDAAGLPAKYKDQILKDAKVVVGGIAARGTLAGEFQWLSNQLLVKKQFDMKKAQILQNTVRAAMDGGGQDEGANDRLGDF